MPTETPQETIQDLEIRLKKRSIFCTILYSVLFLPFLGMAWLSLMILARPIPLWRGFITIFLTLSIPLSMLVSLVCMWVCFNQKQYRGVRFFWSLPFLAILNYCLIDAFLHFFFP